MDQMLLLDINHPVNILINILLAQLLINPINSVGSTLIPGQTFSCIS